MYKSNELTQKEKNILTNYSKKKFRELLKILESPKVGLSNEEISHLELAYYEPFNEIVVLCFYFKEESSLIYSNESESLVYCPYDILLEKHRICLFITSEMKKNNDPKDPEDYSFTPYFNSWGDTAKKLEKAKLDFEDDAKAVSQKAIDIIKKEQRPFKIDYILNN